MTVRHTHRLLVAAAGLGSVLVAAAPAAAGAPAADPAAVQRAVTSADGSALIREFFASAPDAPPGAARAAAPRIVGDPVPVLQLNPDFVRRADAPVTQQLYLASTARSADGRLASVWLTPAAGGGWSIANIASGDVERTFARAAGDAPAFREPQINAWYALRGGRVLPLNDDARRSVGAAGLPVAAYQRLVNERYGDKLPGSAYDRNGTAGGYDAAGTRPAGSDRFAGPGLIGGGLAAAALVGFGLLRRRRTAAA
ncbi:hypothetical protein GCM10010123_44420 [Pilimelia anulata]|uniref:Secreted protein n=1 Tax=Pilimelia anulata TaxID=53371 RepID=A0A8J3BCG6_9ACTN|nr:hypothetical protein [Pilimelia anulata]GGK09636.1 hypothetical protein GCM10010123_44420 [Pilimelia anulata]